MKKAKTAPRKWLTIEATVHIGRRRIGRLLPLRVEPGRKFISGATTLVRGVQFGVRGFGYEFGLPTVHLQKLAR
jgi:hypothetical protein